MTEHTLDNNYVEPAKKQTCANKWGQVADEFRIFKMLDQPTYCHCSRNRRAAALVSPPSGICSPITRLFNLPILTSTVPCQWKTSVITPVAKTKQPTQCIVTTDQSRSSPILSRLLEKIVVRDCIYPIFTHSTTQHLFQDQFAFWPTGSPTSAIIHLN